MGRIIVVANQKGGVGKTTTVMNLAAALAEGGQHVLMVDVDPQAALTAITGFDPYEIESTTYSLLMREEIRLKDIVRPLGDRLWLAPASVDLASAIYALPRYHDRTRRLRKGLEIARSQVAFTLIDTPPSLGILTVNALVAADELLIPVECQYLALRGVRALLETVWLVHDRLHPGLKILGLLPTMFRPGSILSRKIVRELEAVFGDRVFRTVIEEDEAIALAPTERQSVLAYQPDGRAARTYRRLATEVRRAPIGAVTEAG
jgi:chromosome partitioning protein